MTSSHNMNGHSARDFLGRNIEIGDYLVFLRDKREPVLCEVVRISENNSLIGDNQVWVERKGDEFKAQGRALINTANAVRIPPAEMVEYILTKDNA